MSMKRTREKRPMDYWMYGDSTGRKKGTLSRKERWPKWWPAKRKFDGKWYTLEYAGNKKEAEEQAQSWREGVLDHNVGWKAFYARVVRAPEQLYSTSEWFLVYLRPKPLTPKMKTDTRKYRELWNNYDFSSPYGFPSKIYPKKKRR